jgi:hypothetical protein
MFEEIARRISAENAAARRSHQAAMSKLAFFITTENWTAIDELANEVARRGDSEVPEKPGEDSPVDPTEGPELAEQ